MKKEIQYVGIAMAALLGLAVGEMLYLRYKSKSGKDCDDCDDCDDCPENGEEKKEY
jgi:hypothetical protein